MTNIKQIPQKPYEDYYMDSDPMTGEPYPIGIAYFCPNCGAWLVEEESKRCNECNQVIDWRDSE